MFFFFLKKLFFRLKSKKKSIKTEVNDKVLMLNFFFFILSSLKFSYIFSFFKFFFFNYLLHLKNLYINTKEIFFYINLKTEQVKLTILNFELIVINNFTTGFILKLLNIKKKNFRRSQKSFYFIFFFLKKYLSIYLNIDLSIVIFFYKFKFFNLIENFIYNLSSEKINLFFLPLNRLNKFEFRRVSAIKKRIRKKLK